MPSLAILLSLLLASAASAQPTSLLPSADPDTALPRPSAPSAPFAPSAPPAPPTVPAADARAAPAPARIQISELDAPDARALGTLTAQRGGFGPAAWLGSDADEVLPLLDRLRGGSRSAVLQDLTRRLLLTPADPPQGLSAAQFLEVRVRLLLAAGSAADALDLSETTRPDQAIEPGLDRLHTDAAWLVGADRRACNATRVAIRATPSSYWERSNLLCHLAAGDTALASLTANAIAESGAEDGLVMLARALLQGADPAEAVARLAPEPLDIALLRLTDTAPAADFDRNARPAALAAIAELPEAPAELRRRAAEAAAAAGALPVAELAAIWRAEADGGERDATSVARAYRALADEISAAALPRASDATILALLHAGDSAGQADLVARAAAPLLERLPPDHLEARTAAEVIRAFVRAGATDQALSWWQRLRARRDRAEDQAAAVSVWPLLFLAAPDGYLAWSDEALANWAVTAADLPDSVRGDRRDRFLALAGALGAELPARLAATAGGAATGDAAPSRVELLQRVEAAARDGEPGMGVLATVALLRPEGPATAPLPELVRIIRALRDLGLTAAARRMAVESALRAGL